MALFGDKKKQPAKPAGKATAKEAAASDFDSPVEKVSLQAARKSPEDRAKAEAAARAAEQAARERDYGIEQAIQLMRLLPVDSNVELVVQVVKKTLESTNVKVQKIIEDATRKQKDIESRVSTLETEIGDLEKEIQTREREIEALQADHKETTTCKDRLQLAEQLAWAGQGNDPPPPIPPGEGGGEAKQTSEEALTTPARVQTRAGLP